MKSYVQSPEEAKMEKRLIEQLTQGTSQWTCREDIKTIEQLWTNFFKILEQHNQKELNDVGLTENEKAKIKRNMVKPKFFKASQFMVGANQKVSFHLERDDSTLPNANLLILDNLDISGGSSVYEVVHQIEVPKAVVIDQNRRFDVTLLINGLPFIHIELKTEKHPFMDAFNQIQKYINEGKFHDIFCFVKMFVVTNGVNTKYISADQDLNAKFLTTWVDNKNKAINNYLDFAKAVLSIPAAHHMVADYSVLDAESESIIMLRPYQIHAIQAIFKASREGKSGYIWHTTGSGKTLTSYNVARNLLQIPSINKTIFLIDRNDLDTQTNANFKAYADNDTISVEDTNNSYQLANQLNDASRNVIITTKQKLQAIFRRIDANPDDSKKYQKLKNKRFAFVVDECHRTVSPTQKRELENFFNQEQLWYGFTGTPLFTENALEENGQDARTTKQLYGPCLHSYTIENAIKDKMVLGFEVENFGNYHEDEDPEKLDKIYLTEAHMQTVVDKVLRIASRKQGLMYNQRYSAIFTTSSISQAQRYYKLFKKTIADGGVPKRILETYPDFPRIAITYSVTQNDDDSIDNQEEMKESLKDYNNMFNQPFSMDNLSSYNRDVNNRLAGKYGPFINKDNQLDMVIVVDRLLTGFDAPRLSTLYIDRKPMQPQNIIQSFSRTNRLFDSNKRWGQVVTFQHPGKFKEAINDALVLYSNGGGPDALAPDWKTSRDRYVLAQGVLSDFIDKYPDIADITDTDEEDRLNFAKLFHIYDKWRAAVQTYDDADKETLPDFTPEQLEAMRGSYENVVKRLRDDNKKNDEPIDVDEDYELESFHTMEINVRYILSLMNAYVPTDDDEEVNLTSDDIEHVKKQIEQMSKQKPKLSNMLGTVWQEFTENPMNYKNMDLGDILHLKAGEQMEVILSKFAKDYSVNYDDLNYVMARYDLDVDERHQEGMTQLLNNDAFERFKVEHPDSKIPNKLKWILGVRKAVKTVYEDKIEPLENID